MPFENLPNLEPGGDRSLLTVIMLFIMGAVARALVSPEPLDWRRLVGEAILSAIGAVVVFNFGVIQGMSNPEIMLWGALGSLGGIRILEWVIRIARYARGDS